MYEPRVVITGIGPVTPIGTGVGEFWTSLRFVRKEEIDGKVYKVFS